MTMPATEQTAEQVMEGVESALSSDGEGVSEESAETEETEPKDEEPEQPEAKAKAAPDKELEALRKNPKVTSLIQSERDKAVNSYRQTREADTAVIRSKDEKIKELTKQLRTRETDKDIKAILSGD